MPMSVGNPVGAVDPMGLDTITGTPFEIWSDTGRTIGRRLIKPKTPIGKTGDIGYSIGAVSATLIFVSTNDFVKREETCQADGDELTSSRSISVPPRPKKGCTAICRADANDNDNIPHNISLGDKTFAFGKATAKNCRLAVKVAKREATRTLGKQPKHIGCRTSGR